MIISVIDATILGVQISAFFFQPHFALMKLSAQFEQIVELTFYGKMFKGVNNKLYR